MNFVVLSIFPGMFSPFWETGIIRRAIERKKISALAMDIRDFASDRHKSVDDRPYGGGCGMVMKPEPVFAAIRAAKSRFSSARVVLTTPTGRRFSQEIAMELSRHDEIILVCGRYEGLDERIVSGLIDDEISIGDYVLTGGELPAMIIMDAVARLIPGVLGGDDSAQKDSFGNGLLEHPHYTRPKEFEGEAVPDVLMSGNHKEIEKWRFEESLLRTFVRRPDLLKNRGLTGPEYEILKKWHSDIEDILQTQPVSCTDSFSG